MRCSSPFTAFTVMMSLQTLYVTCATFNITAIGTPLKEFLDEYGDYVACPFEERKPLKICGITLPQLKCVSCNRSCPDGGRCVQFTEEIKYPSCNCRANGRRCHERKTTWLRGCVCRKIKTDLRVVSFGEV